MKSGLYTLGKSQGETVMVPAGSTERKEKLAAARHAKLLKAHLRNEARLARVMRAWDKSRTALARSEKRFDQDFARRPTDE